MPPVRDRLPPRATIAGDVGMTLARLFSPCLFNHAEPLMTRDSANAARWACSRCHADLGPILAGEMLDGPAKAQGEVLGAPTGKARRLRAVPSVSTWRKQGER